MNEKKENLPKSLYIILFIILLNSGYMLAVINPRIPTLLLGLTALGLLIRILKMKIKLNRTSIIVALNLSSIVVLTMIINSDYKNYLTYSSILIYIVLGMSISNLYSFKKFSSIYLIFVRIISVISLIFYYSINLFGINFNLPIIINKSGAYIYNAYIYFIYPQAVQRNFGVFWEPGMYQGILIIALMLSLFFEERKQNIIDISLFSITIITTQSTTGAILLIFMLLMTYLKNKNGLEATLLSIFVVIILAAIVIYKTEIITYLANIMPNLFQKLLTDNASKNDRLFSPISDIYVATKYPFFGIGINNQWETTMQYAYQAGYEILTQTSTITTFAATFGFIFTGFYIFGWVKGVLNQKINKSSKFIIMIVITILLWTEIHNYVALTYCLMFFFISNNVTEQKNSLN